jgi:heparan-alpha-glucosaminide N-acetyltransferase
MASSVTERIRSDSLPLPSAPAAEAQRTNGIPAAPATKPERLVSLDAYRGFIMLAMASGGFALPAVAKHFPDSPAWQFLSYQASHAPWVGCSFWDLIQPSFMFMVGVAMPYSITSRRAKGDSERTIFGHVLYRAAFLVFLGVFLSSNWSPRTNFTFVNVLSQIGLGYAFLYLLLGRGHRVQLAALGGILVGYWLFFLLYPLPAAGFDYAAVGWNKDWVGLPGWFAHWDKNTNAAAAFDSWFLPLFPPANPAKPFRFNEGGYQTLNFIPSLATMILGLMAGEFLRTGHTRMRKFATLVLAGAVCLGLGLAAGEFLCPIVKRIWTPSWALFSAGWTFWILAAFFWVIDVQGYRRWAFPLLVVGMNSIVMYCMAQLIKGWVGSTLRTHLGSLTLASLEYLVKPALAVFNVAADPWWLNNTFGPMVESATVLFVLWLICLWLYRRGIFVRI